MSSVLNEEKIRATTGGLTLEDIFQESDYLQNIAFTHNLSPLQQKTQVVRLLEDR